MKMLFIIHAPFEQPGSIEEWAKKRGHETQKVHPYLDQPLPDIKDIDFLVVMGGPQSPLGIKEAPYLETEIDYIKEAIRYKKRIIGVCLGAQLIGEALGAKTERSPHREIGAYPLELLDAAQYDPIFQQFPKNFDVMHWHNDMPGLPEGAVLLAKSEGCPRQIFSFGDRIYGFQCHFELTKEWVKEMMIHCGGDLKAGKYVMTPEEWMNIDYAAIHSKLDVIMDYLASLPELVLTKSCDEKEHSCCTFDS